MENLFSLIMLHSIIAYLECELDGKDDSEDVIE